MRKKKICCITCNKYRKFKNPKISHIFDKTLGFSFICDNCGNKEEKTFKEQESIEILIILVLIDNMNE